MPWLVSSTHAGGSCGQIFWFLFHQDEDFISRGLRIIQGPSGSRLLHTVLGGLVLSGLSTMKVWLVECCTDGCSYLKISNLHKSKFSFLSRQKFLHQAFCHVCCIFVILFHPDASTDPQLAKLLPWWLLKGDLRCPAAAQLIHSVLCDSRLTSHGVYYC